MAGDAVAVLDALGWRSAHVVGRSLGGMIAQTLAIEHPDGVRSLTLISSTPSWRIGRETPATTLRLLRARRATRRGRGAEGAAERLVAASRVFGSPGCPPQEAWVREVARQMYGRGGLDAAGARRQNASILAGGDRRARLAGVRVPTLVIHGEADPIVRLEGGRATAAAIPGAKLVTFAGMGHDLPPELWPAIIDEIRAVADRANDRRRRED